jgi:hypothetical protein
MHSEEKLHNGVPAVDIEEMRSWDSTTIHLESGKIISLMKIGFLQMTVKLKWQPKLTGGYKNQIPVDLTFMEG